MKEKSKKSFSSGDTKLKSFLEQKSKPKENESYQPISENIYQNPALAEVQKKVINTIDSKLVTNIKDEKKIKDYVQDVLDRVCDTHFPTITNSQRLMVTEAIMNEFTGLGPLQDLMLDASVSEIMVNGPNQIYVERKGVLKLSKIQFRDDEHVIQIIDKIVSPLGRRIDESSPMVDARLSDGSRVNAIIPPIALTGPTITVRKFPEKPLTINNLVEYGTLNKDMAKFLELAVKTKNNIIVAGGTGSGKTTFLNVLSAFIPDNERIITIEDAAELRLSKNHIISLEARPANIENKGEITIRDLVRNSLRMRPDRIVIGEVRGVEALDMLQAMNTGHNGSLSTIHANAPRDALTRLETMVLYTGIDFPIRAIREQIQSALNIIVYIQRLPDGSRKVTEITEVLGMEGDVIILQDIFTFVNKGISRGKIKGEFQMNSIRPKSFEKFSPSDIKELGWYQ